ncbi:hypothetical protein FDUTEX481_02278 [Tolypothrix sp. PCC 7601]|nr:hypothetical protein FDUTEX481_02278 [Tolypothrix sp. PCC 7601]
MLGEMAGILREKSDFSCGKMGDGAIGDWGLGKQGRNTFL